MTYLTVSGAATDPEVRSNRKSFRCSLLLTESLLDGHLIAASAKPSRRSSHPSRRRWRTRFRPRVSTRTIRPLKA